MAATPVIKGWCPGAWRPMASGDGLLVRIKPPHGRLTRRQALALCETAERHGAGLIELTSRANLQVRGVEASRWPELMACLAEQRLVDPDLHREQRRNVLLAPDWQAGDDSDRAARLLLARLGELPPLPDKVGFAIDAGRAPVLGTASADFRLERAADGGLLVRAEGHARGTPVASVEAAVTQLVKLAHWFADSGGGHAGRMRRHVEPLPAWAAAQAVPAAARDIPRLGSHPLGSLVGLPFGRVAAAALRAALEAAPVTGVRVTPWRRLLLEGAKAGPSDGLVVDESDPRLSIDACPGAPYCAQASVATLDLAERLAGRFEGSLHVSGCAKGCARRRPANVCLSGRDGRYALITGGRADDAPVASGLDESDVLAWLMRPGTSPLSGE